MAVTADRIERHREVKPETGVQDMSQSTTKETGQALKTNVKS